MHNEEDNRTYKVVVNHEEQYSIWLAHKPSPDGWREVGKTGLKGECLAYIKEVWTDLRPLSLRKKMEAAAANPSPPPKEMPAVPRENELVNRLCEGDHPVEARTFPEKSAAALKEGIQRQYIHIKFPNTRGGTELGIKLNPEKSDWSKADFDRGEGTVKLVGNLTLDYTKLSCSSEIDLKTLSGTGRLQKV